MDTVYASDAKIFKAFCDEKRLRILELLRDGEKCACVLIEHMEIGQSSLSYHMKILCESGIVESRQVGKWTHYKINDEGRKHALERLLRITETNTNPIICNCEK
ncbi:ArsR family transcriptional regulator [Peptacetobacter hominis]|uniref:ArsR family transcriptional regulator n=1 Tax=Peptacetobacter hominis TaxID=2743610 RepID=A0A544QUN0_9FIRM|nr:metalloregulator ArsR/SmtB family transcription factor [Peptacetobacter hominis]TQQ84392.1 ArsR family transcriptional regulator [Peptacetobacter hominis]